MDTRIREILLQIDSARDVEYPPGFDWQASMAAVQALKPHAERILGQPLKMDDQVQDASFFADLFVFDDEVVGPNGVTTRVFKIAIRFSNFGKMATIHTNSSTSDLHRYPVDRLAKLLEHHGFQYIPAESLSEPYDGKVEGLDGLRWQSVVSFFRLHIAVAPNSAPRKYSFFPLYPHVDRLLEIAFGGFTAK